MMAIMDYKKDYDQQKYNVEIERFLNVMDSICAKYFQKAVNQKWFEITYSNEIRDFITTDSDLKKYYLNNYIEFNMIKEYSRKHFEKHL